MLSPAFQSVPRERCGMRHLIPLPLQNSPVPTPTPGPAGWHWREMHRTAWCGWTGLPLQSPPALLGSGTHHSPLLRLPRRSRLELSTTPFCPSIFLHTACNFSPPHFFCPEEGLMHTKYWFRLSIKTALMKGGVAPGLSAATSPPCQRMPSQSKRVGPAHGLLPSDTT